MHTEDRLSGIYIEIRYESIFYQGHSYSKVFLIVIVPNRPVYIDLVLE